MLQADKNRQLIDQMYSCLNQRKLEQVFAYFSPRYAGYDTALRGNIRGREGARSLIGMYLHAFPDLTWTIPQMISERNQITVHWSARGTHQGKWMNIPATGQSVFFQGITIYRIEDAVIDQGFTIWDLANLLRLLGILPDLME